MSDEVVGYVVLLIKEKDRSKVNYFNTDLKSLVEKILDENQAKLDRAKEMRLNQEMSEDWYNSRIP